MINITFPDGSEKQFDKGISGSEIASNISVSLSREALVVEVNGELRDLSLPIETDCRLRILTSKDPECLEVLRHDAAHIVAQAVKELFRIRKNIL